MLIQIVAKVLAWRIVSLTLGFILLFLFLGEVTQAGVIAITFNVLFTIFHGIFEWIWEKYVAERLKNLVFLINFLRK